MKKLLVTTLVLLAVAGSASAGFHGFRTDRDTCDALGGHYSQGFCYLTSGNFNKGLPWPPTGECRLTGTC